ncbi:GNAT family N-acetyltransferase [Puia sp. P3]|uniref:GNAT family N-acetyltransferase n=1 Tax=Puia sp. P3 TaxID=3423952 RepID=UPI003D674C2C
MNITYKTDQLPDTASIIDLYASSGLSRPIDDSGRIESMYYHSNLVISAWDGPLLVGVSRALTDFHYCCYLSDLAVRKEYQKAGIGKQLVGLTKEAIGDRCMLLLLAAPSAMDYYPRIGMDTVNNGFIIKRAK